MAAVTVRTFGDGDRAALRDLFARVGADSPTGELWGHTESEADVYLTPYMGHEPGSLLLAEVDGALVGYLTGCLDSSALPSESDRMVRAMSTHRLVTKPTVLGFLARSATDVLRARIRSEPTTGAEFSDPRWPAHLHINVVPEARGTGAADALMRRWIERLAEHGSPGCYLQTLVENTRAVRFFERSGFTAFGPTPLVPGIRFRGAQMHQLTMVRPAAM